MDTHWSTYIRMHQVQWILRLVLTMWEHLFWMYTAVIYALNQRNSGNPWSNSMALATPTIVLFFCSATPFCCGVWGTVCSFLIPSAKQYSMNSMEVYSPPLSYFLFGSPRESWTLKTLGTSQRPLTWPSRNRSRSSWNSHQWRWCNNYNH